MALAVDERRYGARLVAAADLFDLDHFGAEIGQDQRAERDPRARATDRTRARRRAGRGVKKPTEL